MYHVTSTQDLEVLNLPLISTDLCVEMAAGAYAGRDAIMHIGTLSMGSRAFNRTIDSK